VAALGLTTMPHTRSYSQGAAVTRRTLAPCRKGASCDRDHRHLFQSHWTKQSACDYMRSMSAVTYGFFVDPKNAGFLDEIVTAINSAPTSLIP
jgi:hypothetical protein